MVRSNRYFKCPYCRSGTVAFGVPCARCSITCGAFASDGKCGAVALHLPTSTALRWVLGATQGAPRVTAAAARSGRAVESGTYVVPASWLRPPARRAAASAAPRRHKIPPRPPSLFVPCTQGAACRLHCPTLGCLTAPRVLGRGGQAIACSATILNASECSTRRVAAKEMKARPQDVPHLLARMQVCQGFAHENLARVLAVWQVAHDTYAIAMELCPGTLYDVMQMLRSAQRLPCYRFVREVLRGQLAALAYMQSRGFVHRDVKPQNIAFDLCADFDAEYPEVAKGITLTGSARAREIMCFLAEEWPTPSRADALPPFEVKLIDFDWGRPVGDLTPSGCLATAASANPGTRIFRPDQLPAGASVLDFYRGDIYSAAATAICCAEIVHPSTTVAPEEMQSAEHFAAKCKGPWLERGYPVEFFELVVDMMSSHPAVRPDAPTALRRLMEIPLS